MNLTLKNVAEFERPAGSADDDPQVGEDELGNPLFLNRMSGQKYKVSLAPDQRTTKTKVADTLSNLRMPTLKEIGTVALDAAKGLWDVVDTPSAIAAGEKQPTLGDAYAVGGMGATSTLPFAVPKGATRVFGGLSGRANLSSLDRYLIGQEARTLIVYFKFVCILNFVVKPTSLSE